MTREQGIKKAASLFMATALGYFFWYKQGLKGASDRRAYDRIYVLTECNL